MAGAVILLATGLGLYARFDGLGTRQLAEDEYYFVRSVQAILEHGVPLLQGGGYYVRSLVPQYITAGSVALFGDNGFGYRLPAVLFNLGAVAAAFVYARQHLPRFLAIIVPALLLVSSWEVEFARFARMYAPFQLTTLLLLIVVTRILDGDVRANRWLLPVVVLNLLTHELAVLFLPTLALPPALAWWRRRSFSTDGSGRYAFGALAVAALGLMLLLVDFRNWGAVDPLPAGYSSDGAIMLRVPDLAFAGTLVPFLLLVAGTMVLRLGWRLLHRRPGTAMEALAWFAFLSALGHALLLWTISVALLFGRYGVPLRRAQVPKNLVFASFGLAVAWVVYFAAAIDIGPTQLVRALFGWPNLIDPVALPWKDEMPLLGSALLASVIGAIVLHAREPLPRLLRSPGVPVAYVLLAFGVLHSTYAATRYLFFVYPVALVALVLVLWALTRWSPWRWAALPLAVGGFVMSEDFELGHLLAVPSTTVTFRLEPYDRYWETWYMRYDLVSVADFLHERVGREISGEWEPVIIFNVVPLKFYLQRPSALYFDRETPRYPEMSRHGGTAELWTGGPLLGTQQDLRRHVGGASRVWLVNRIGTPLPVPADSIWPAANVQVGRHHVGRDGRLEVLRVDRNPGATFPISLGPASRNVARRDRRPRQRPHRASPAQERGLNGHPPSLPAALAPPDCGNRVPPCKAADPARAERR